MYVLPPCRQFSGSVGQRHNRFGRHLRPTTQPAGLPYMDRVCISHMAPPFAFVDCPRDYCVYSTDSPIHLLRVAHALYMAIADIVYPVVLVVVADVVAPNILSSYATTSLEVRHPINNSCTVRSYLPYSISLRQKRRFGCPIYKKSRKYRISDNTYPQEHRYTYESVK